MSSVPMSVFILRPRDSVAQSEYDASARLISAPGTYSGTIQCSACVRMENKSVADVGGNDQEGAEVE